MANDGIGASVLRKEDKRFITGKGRYTDDIAMNGMTHAAFVRSPHAHARIKSIDVERGEGDSRRARRADRRRSCRRRDRRPDLRLADPLQGRLADEGGRAIRRSPTTWSAMSATSSPWSSPRPATRPATRAEKVDVDYEDLPAVIDPAKAQDPASPQVHPEAPGNLIFRWGLGNEDETKAALARAKHVTKLDIVNNRLDPLRHRAARRDRLLRSGREPLHPLQHHPEPACRAAGAVGLRRHRAREQAPRHRARCRRRLRLEDLHLCRGDDLPLGLEAGRRPAGQVDRGPERVVPLRCPRPRSRHPRRDGLRCRQPHHRAQRPHDREFRRLHVDVLVVDPDLPLRARCSPASTTFRRSMPRSTRSTPTPRRSTPCAAPAGPEAAFVIERLMETASRELGVDPAELRRKNFITSVPAPDAGDHELRRRRLCGLARHGAEGGRLRRLRDSARQRRRSAASSAASASRAGSRPAASRRRRRSARSAPASACGSRPRSRVNPVGTVEVLTGAHATARATRRPSPRSSTTGSASASTTSRSSTATPTRCSSAWAPTARGRSVVDVGDRHGARQGRSPRRKKIAAHSSRPPRATSSSRTASSRSPAPTARSLRRDRACRLYRRTTSRRHVSRD